MLLNKTTTSIGGWIIFYEKYFKYNMHGGLHLFNAQQDACNRFSAFTLVEYLKWRVSVRKHKYSEGNMQKSSCSTHRVFFVPILQSLEGMS